MTSNASTPIPPKHNPHVLSHRDPRFQAAVAHATKLKCMQLIQSGLLRPVRHNSRCNGEWKPRMDLIDDPSSPNIVAIFELPGVKNDQITLQIKDKKLVVFGTRADPLAEARSCIRQSNGSVSHVDGIQAESSSSSTLFSSGSSIRELRYGSFYRTIPVPDGIKQPEVTAGLQDGMLTVSWPRVPAASRQTVTTISGNPASGNKPMTDGEITAQTSTSNDTTA